MAKEVQDWLNTLGLGQYAETFEENDIGWETLLELDHGLLKEAGVQSIGHRVALLKSIKEMAAGQPAR